MPDAHRCHSFGATRNQRRGPTNDRSKGGHASTSSGRPRAASASSARSPATQANARGDDTMLPNMPARSRRSALVGVTVAAALLAWAPPSEARVTRIIIDRTASLSGQDIAYETLTGRAFGELDPNDPHNALITDIVLAPKNANGKVDYIASFFIVKPVDM